MITNADTGVLVSLSADQAYLATTNGNSLATLVPVNINSGGGISSGTGSTTIITYTPILQAQDGSFVGTFVDDQRTQHMASFDASGNQRWTVLNDTPQIATADGGVIGTSGTIYRRNPHE